MCGIAGIYKREEPVLLHELEKMAEKLTHRGPDNQGFYLDKNLGMAHTRLSIIDLTGGNQPLFNKDKDLILIANGEIYNFIELREELEKKGCKFQTNSDCETILHAYKVFGLEFVQKLYGMFAFALFDKKEKKLILARDRLGIKPLFYSLQDGKFFFGSEIKSILPVFPKTPRINLEALAHFFMNQFSTGRDTIFTSIKRLLPGELLIIDNDLNFENKTYWSLKNVLPRNISFSEASEEFDSLFTEVVSQHLRSDVPYGLFLSGGLDSGTLLAMLNRLQDRQIRTFSIGYQDVKMKDEITQAEFIAKKFNTKHTSILVTKKQLLFKIPYNVWCIDDLMRDYASFPTSILSETASNELKVVLTGEGGDEVFAGYGRYRVGFTTRMIKNFFCPGSGGFRTRGTISKIWISKIFLPKMKKAASTYRRPFCKLWKDSNPKWSILQKYQYIDIACALPDNLLVKVDRTTMGYGLEARVPFLDHRIVEFGFSLPDPLKIKPHQGKVFLKKWAEKYLPKEHLYRSKSGFRVPVGEWLKGKFLNSLKDKLKNNSAIKEYFDISNFDELFSCAQKEKKYAIRTVWCLMQFAIWENLFVEHTAIKPGDEENPLDWIR